ncbi:MAG: hypothetical protein GY821_06320 [Gammaproteobacteria bacterium]|nr:hypothetical protein [Gammaproteobacteria bacterium]
MERKDRQEQEKGLPRFSKGIISYRGPFEEIWLNSYSGLLRTLAKKREQLQRSLLGNLASTLKEKLIVAEVPLGKSGYKFVGKAAQRSDFCGQQKSSFDGRQYSFGGREKSGVREVSRRSALDLPLKESWLLGERGVEKTCFWVCLSGKLSFCRSLLSNFVKSSYIHG